MSSTSFHGTREADFFPSQIIQNGRLVLFEFGIKISVFLDHGFGNFGEERFIESDLGAEARGAADDHARDVVASRVARDDAIGDEERGGADVVADDAIGREIGEHFFFSVTCERAQNIERAGEEVGLVVGVDALQNGDDALEAHAGVNVLGGQRFEAAIVEEIVLNEDVVPQFEEARAFAVHAADVVGAAQVVELFAEIKVDLGTRTAGTRLCHLPEVFLAPKEQRHAKGRSRAAPSKYRRLRHLCGTSALIVILKTSGVDFILGQAPDIGQQLPRPGDGFLFVVIAKGPVAEHLKEGVMRVVAAHVVEVVVLACHAHTLLRVDGAFVGLCIGADEDILELHHARVGEEQASHPRPGQATWTARRYVRARRRSL